MFSYEYSYFFGDCCNEGDLFGWHKKSRALRYLAANFSPALRDQGDSDLLLVKASRPRYTER
jgi:hypothetical protein